MGSAVAYLLAALVLTTLVGSFRAERTGPKTRLRADIVEGVRYLAGNRVLRTLALCVGLSNLASTATDAVMALYVVDPGPMGLSEAGFGLILLPFAVGSLLATPFVERVQRRFGNMKSLLGAIVLFPVWQICLALTAAVPPFVLATLSAGFVNVIWNVITVSLRQRIAPDHLLGRVNAGYRLLAWGTMPIGAAMGGILGELIGLRGVFWVSAGLGLLCIPLLLANVSDAAIAAAELESGHEPEAEPALL
jgi:MFS family permease